MTIEELIASKLRKAKIVGFLFWLAFAATIFFPLEGKLFFFSLIPFAGFGGTVIYVMYFLKCPKCSSPVGQASLSPGNPFNKKSKLNYCPNCGVSFNERV